MVVLSTGISLFITDLGIVLELSGNIAGVMLAYLLPSFIALKLDWHEHHWQSLTTWKQVFLFVFGIIAFFSGTFFTIKQAIYDD